VIVMKAISTECRVVLPGELLYADDLDVIAETEEDLIKRLNEWKNNVENRGMRVNISVVTVAGICNSVGGGVLFNIPPRWRWRISVQYAPCNAGEGESSAGGRGLRCEVIGSKSARCSSGGPSTSPS